MTIQLRNQGYIKISRLANWLASNYRFCSFFVHKSLKTEFSSTSGKRFKFFYRIIRYYFEVSYKDKIIYVIILPFCFCIIVFFNIFLKCENNRRSRKNKLFYGIKTKLYLQQLSFFFDSCSLTLLSQKVLSLRGELCLWGEKLLLLSKFFILLTQTKLSQN